jgi:hypothetical protein
MPTRRSTLAFAATLGALSFTGLAAAQGKYPSTVKLIVAPLAAWT